MKPNHGTTARFGRGCRCQPCRDARNIYERRRRKLRILYGTHYAIDATGTRRRIMALARLGWTFQHIAEAAGWQSGEACGQTLRRTFVERATAASVMAAYDQLSMKIGPSRATRNRSERKGWPPPLAWDDDTIDDPNATPHTGKDTPGNDVDDIVWLVRCGGTWASISERMGVTKDGIDRALRRAGRLDVIADLARGGSRNQWNGEVAS